MVKPLDSNDNTGISGQKNASDKAKNPSHSSDSGPAILNSTQKNSDFSNIDVGAYSKDTMPFFDLNQKSWDASDTHSKHSDWMADPKSRLGIRVFSRGVLGAAFFTAGSMISRKWMDGYDVTKAFSNQTNKNPLTFLAKLIDTTIGAPIEAAVSAVSGAEAGKRAVLFRPTFYPGKSSVGRKRVWGRSLGGEMIDVTFDFFCASVGDAWGRDIAGFFDPNVKKDWIDDKGHVQFPKAIDHALKAATRYITYNGGEDWAVALPYVYFMKGQRSLINKFSPGFKYDFDQAKNGNSFKMGGHPLSNGSPDYNHISSVVGSYAPEGMIDLQSRFTVYNIGTLMYREVYDVIKDRLHGKHDKLYGSPDQPEDPNKGVMAKAGELVKWTARSVIKGTMIMTPSVPLFWITRTTQNKHRGLFIHPEHGMMTRQKTGSDKYYTTVEPADSYQRKELLDKDVYYSHYDKNLVEDVGAPYDRIGPMNARTANPGVRPGPNNPDFANYTGPTFHPYQMGNGLSDKVLNGIGSAQYKAAKLLEPGAKWMDNHGGAFGASIKNTLGFGAGMESKSRTAESFTRFTQPFARASMSYTPYMYAKAEFANLWDNGKMDMAAERLIDGAAKLNWNEFKAGAGEVWNTMLDKPLDDPRREVEGNHRIQIDTSPPEIVTQAEFEKSKVKEAKKASDKEKKAETVRKIETDRVKVSPLAWSDKQPSLSWQERVVSSRPLSSKESEKVYNHADKEAMRKALEEMNPPTNAIN